MASKKSPPKRSNGAEEPEPAKAELKQTKPRTRKVPASSTIEPLAYNMSDEEIARRAYALWESRGKPLGSPEEDWHRAKEQLGC